MDDLLSGRAFRGGGQEFRLEAMPGTVFQRYTASFREPFLFDSPYSLGLSAYYYTRIFNEYTESRVGSQLSLGRQLTPNWSVSTGVRLENVGVHNVPEDIDREIAILKLRSMGVTIDTLTAEQEAYLSSWESGT